MNRERIRALIEDLKTSEDFELDMSEYAFGSRKPESPDNLCGTVCCLAGLVCLRDGKAEMIYSPEQNSLDLVAYGSSSPATLAREILNISINDALALFYPLKDKGRTREEAIAVLENFLETGRVNW